MFFESKQTLIYDELEKFLNILNFTKLFKNNNTEEEHLIYFILKKIKNINLINKKEEDNKNPITFHSSPTYIKEEMLMEFLSLTMHPLVRKYEGSFKNIYSTIIHTNKFGDEIIKFKTYIQIFQGYKNDFIEKYKEEDDTTTQLYIDYLIYAEKQLLTLT